eukprot:7015121-Prymnesium_polylepis.1
MCRRAIPCGAEMWATEQEHIASCACVRAGAAPAAPVMSEMWYISVRERSGGARAGAGAHKVECG